MESLANCNAQLIAVEAKLAKDPDNQEFLSLKSDLLELIELSQDIEEEEQHNEGSHKSFPSSTSRDNERNSKSRIEDSSGLKTDDIKNNSISKQSNIVDIKNNSKRTSSEAELLVKRKEKNRKKRAKLIERIKEQSEFAESEKQSWQSFASKKGLKGVSKKSIFASPCSVTGKVGVGTNGIADTPSATGASTLALNLRKKY